MTDKDAQPRIAPLSKLERSADDEKAIAKSAASDGTEYNIFTTAARHRLLFPPLLQLTMRMLHRGDLLPRTREIAILRTAATMHCEYEQIQHEALATKLGFGSDEIKMLRQVGEGADPGSHSDDLLVVKVTDELLKTGTLTGETWGRLTEVFTETQIIELVLVVGHYHTLALFLNALKVQPDAAGLVK